MSGTTFRDRVFKTAWFCRAVRKAGISDKELCDAVAEVAKGQADELGGGVFKKRLDRNRQRAIILHRAAGWWFFVFMFAKQNRANIDDRELAGFRKLARSYAAMNAAMLETLIAVGDITEICHESKAEVSQ